MLGVTSNSKLPGRKTSVVVPYYTDLQTRISVFAETAFSNETRPLALFHLLIFARLASAVARFFIR
jgi:hypothetical protein